MDEITIVRKRSRVWPILLALLLIIAIVLVALYIIGDRSIANVGWNEVIEFAGRNGYGRIT